MVSELPVLEISGGPREKGHAHGEIMRSEIRELISGFRETVLEHSKGRNHTISQEWWRNWALQNVPYISNYYPDLLEEVEAIAKSANVSLEDILCLNLFLDIWDWVTPHIFQGRYGRAQGCTAFGISGLTNSQEAIIGQNYDLEALFQKGAILLRINDRGGTKSLVFTIAGIVGCAGLNNHGLAVVINNLTARDAQAGVPYPFIIRRLLFSSNIGESIDSIVGAQRSSGMNYMLASKCGAVISIESSAIEYVVSNSFNQPITHANHYLQDRLIPQEARSIVDRGHSIYRQYRTEYLLNKIENYDMENLFKILRDHQNHPIGICRHDEPEDTCGKTIASMVFLPRQQRAYFTAGNPCESEFREYQL